MALPLKSQLCSEWLQCKLDKKFPAGCEFFLPFCLFYLVEVSVFHFVSDAGTQTHGYLDTRQLLSSLFVSLIFCSSKVGVSGVTDLIALQGH